MEISSEIKKLIEDRTLSASLYDIMFEIALKKSLKGSSAAHTPEQIEDQARDDAGDFLLELSKDEITGDIKTSSDLKREFGRWLTRRNAPERAELWTVISEALLSMERDGEVSRPDQYRRFNNSNETPWALVKYAGKTAQPLEDKQIADIVAVRKRKGEHNRLFKPAEARFVVRELLSLGKGDLIMQELFSMIADHLPLFKEISLQAPLARDREQDEDRTIEDSIEADPVIDDNNIIILEQVNHACKQIMEAVEAIDHARRRSAVSAIEVLCGYFLPKEIFGKKVKLEKFGPSSTVQNIVSDLRRAFADYLPEKGCGRLEDLMVFRITKGIIENIVKICSEKGVCAAFSENKDQEVSSGTES